MNSTKQIITGVLLSFLIVVIGTAGYMIFEGWSFIDSVYMTFITITTVGFGEIRTLSQIGRIFTIILIFFGFGFCIYVAGSVVQFMVEGRIRTILGRRRLDRKVKRITHHYIICGYGRIGRVLCQKLQNVDTKMIVIEKNPELIRLLEDDGILYVAGDATDESVLVKAGIKKAKLLVAALGTDTENVFLVLTAKQLNKDIHIIARSGKETSKAKLKAAGADSVESPYEMGATRMAQRILRPTVTSFLDLAYGDKSTDIQMEEIPVTHISELVDVTLMDSGIRKRFNLIVVAIKTAEGRMKFNPSFDTTIRSGDTVIAVGEAENLKKLEKILNAKEIQPL